MSTPAGMVRIQDGYAYKNGQPIELYSHGDTAAVAALLLKKCFDWTYGPLTIHACGDSSGPSASVNVTLLGVSIGDCELSPQHKHCRIGGAIAGFKVEIDVVLTDKPLELEVTGTLCTPFAGCEGFHYTLPL